MLHRSNTLVTGCWLKSHQWGLSSTLCCNGNVAKADELHWALECRLWFLTASPVVENGGGLVPFDLSQCEQWELTSHRTLQEPEDLSVEWSLRRFLSRFVLVFLCLEHSCFCHEIGLDLWNSCDFPPRDGNEIMPDGYCVVVHQIWSVGRGRSPCLNQLPSLHRRCLRIIIPVN